MPKVCELALNFIVQFHKVMSPWMDSEILLNPWAFPLRQGEKVVAVKRLMGDKSKGEREFVAEMETLGKVKHANIVPLLGYCSCGTDRLLIYDYMPNGNLDLWLHTSARVSAGRKALDWSTRLKIALVRNKNTKRRWFIFC